MASYPQNRNSFQIVILLHTLSHVEQRRSMRLSLFLASGWIEMGKAQYHPGPLHVSTSKIHTGQNQERVGVKRHGYLLDSLAGKRINFWSTVLPRASGVDYSEKCMRKWLGQTSRLIFLMPIQTLQLTIHNVQAIVPLVLVLCVQ